MIISLSKGGILLGKASAPGTGYSLCGSLHNPPSPILSLRLRSAVPTLTNPSPPFPSHCDTNSPANNRTQEFFLFPSVWLGLDMVTWALALACGPVSREEGRKGREDGNYDDTQQLWVSVPGTEADRSLPGLPGWLWGVCRKSRLPHRNREFQVELLPISCPQVGHCTYP